MKIPSLPTRLAAAGLTIALAGGAALTATAQDGGPPPFAGHGRHAPMPPHGGGFEGGLFGAGPGFGRLLERVNATEAQRTQIRQISEAAAKDLQAQHEQRRTLHEQAVALFTQPTVDAAAAERLRQQELQLHDQASRRMLQARLDIARVLTPEQRQQIAQLMKQRRDLFERQARERRELK